MDPFETFRKQLRSTLNHLYDPDYLRRSPLITLLSPSGGYASPVELQRTLEEAIESLRPAPDTPVNSAAWLSFDILVSRYIHHLSQEQVANQIGVSTRQLVRAQEHALGILAEKLWNEYHLAEKALKEGGDGDDRASPAGELRWLKETPGNQFTGVEEEMKIVMTLLQPLAEHYAVRLSLSQREPVANTTVHPVAFRQALISVISAAVSGAKGGAVTIQVQAGGAQSVEITVVGDATDPTQLRDEKREEDLRLARNIIEMSHGSMEITQDKGAFFARLSLPAVQPVKVLVIDDNRDFLDLFQRYTSGTNYVVVGTTRPDEILPLFETHQPKGIIIDIMMPDIDGWQLLAKLHRHPLTSHVPIFICSIVSNEELASTLGASGYIRKPVSRESLLKVLEQLDSGPGSVPGTALRHP